MLMKFGFCLVFLLAGIAANLSAQEPLVQIETVRISHPGNPADVTGLGAVDYEYLLGKYEVSISTYTTFLNTVAASDPYRLYNPAMATDANVAGILRSGENGNYVYSVIGDGNRPISYVSWFDAARFCNWLHNGALKGSDTENGSYPLNGVQKGIIEKNPNAKWWIPTENEWYKAAYYQPANEGGDTDGYWLYATSSNNPPGNEMGNQPNQANYRVGAESEETLSSVNQNYLTPGGAFSASPTFFGTFDQTGNVWEWVDAVIDNARGLRGGGWNNPLKYQPASLRHGPFPPVNELHEVGLRLAGAPVEK